MWSEALLLWMLLLQAPGSTGDIVLTQSPVSLAVLAGERVTISCTASEGISIMGIKSVMQCYQQKPGQAPKLLISRASYLESGFLDLFSGSQSETDFTLTIHLVEAEDATDSYYHQGKALPPTLL
ncbi:Ig kappa chain V-III region MOPC 321 [Heterocephalus glaber]|nr:Ig kappa chain V-III region MOPC 321 [Heterocephalus glaber]